MDILIYCEFYNYHYIYISLQNTNHCRNYGNRQTHQRDRPRDAKPALGPAQPSGLSQRSNLNHPAGQGGRRSGGHLAAAAGNITGLEEKYEDHSVSSRPNALVLFNPVLDKGPGGFGYKQFGNRYAEISPLHNIRPGALPTIFFRSP